MVREVFLLNLDPGRVSVDGVPADLHRSPPAKARLRTIDCGGDFRRALLLSPGSEARFRSVLRPRARAVFGIGFTGSSAGSALRFRLELVAVAADGVEHTLWEDTVSPPEDEDARRWRDVEVELRGHPQGDLVFRTAVVPGATAGPADPRPGFSNPRLLFAGPELRFPPSAERHVVLFLIDTLRQDRLGLYGNRRSPSPNLDRLARESLVFGQAQAASSWTKASVASLFTSRPPSLHGAEDYEDRLRAGERTLAHVFGAQGYRTAAFGFNTWVFNPKFHMGEGFQTFVEVNDRTSDRETRSDAVIDETLDWIERNHHRPFFLYIHTIDPHAPYEPLPEMLARVEPQGFAGEITGRLGDFDRRRGDSITRAEMEHLLALYDAEIAFNDAQVGRVIEALQRLGLWDECTFVLTADHGEEFLDHGAWSHGGTLYQEQLLVPLVVKPPRSRRLQPARIQEPVSMLDVAPTLCALAGVSSDDSPFHGRSLLPLVEEPRLWTPGPLVSELARAGRQQFAIRRGASKYILTTTPVRKEQLFDLERDPGEHHDLAGSVPAATLESFRAELQAHWAATAGDGFFLCFSSAGPAQAAPARAVTVRLHAAQPLTGFRLLSSEWSEDTSETSEDPPGLALRLSTGGGDPRDCLNLRTNEETLTVQVEVDGAPLAIDAIWLGASGEHPPSNPWTLRLDDPRLAWDQATEPSDPPGIGCRVWMRQRAGVELDEQELQLLRKLGY